MKSLQFRSIAPKAPAVAPSLSPTALSCQSNAALPEATTACTPIIVPTQNYALMQIAGQDGTFSLVALPPSVSSQTPQHQTQPFQKNFKLPIPRYQPMRNRGSDRVKSPASPASKLKSASKVVGKPQAKSVLTTLKKKQHDFKYPKKTRVCKEEPTEQLILSDPTPSDFSVTTVLTDNAVLSPTSQLEQVPFVSKRPAGRIQSLESPPDVKDSPCRSPEESKAILRICPLKPAAAQPQSSITVLSPAIFSKTVQIDQAPPNGKLPILPSSKIKSLPEETKATSQLIGLTNSTELSSKNGDVAQTLGPNQMLNSVAQPQAKALPGLGTLQKPPGKKRGRKRKTMEDILAFEARKKRSLSFFRKRVPEKPAAVQVSKQKEVDISKKYRSIRPKPMFVMETLPQLVNLSALADGQEEELVLGHHFPSTTPIKEQECASLPTPVTLQLTEVSHPRRSRALYYCPTCSRSFQFKHHLQSHMNSHTNSRPHVCAVCRKAYAHSGSLSTHMKLHHSEVHPRRSLHCEFCEKAFGYVGVYFNHLKEVHKVILTVEPSDSHHEEDADVKEATPLESSEKEKHHQELQIECGRCQTVTSTFADMKVHLLCAHGEEIQVRLCDGQSPCAGGEAEAELVKHAAHFWRQLNERRSLVRCGGCDEDLPLSKLKRRPLSRQQGREDAGGRGGGVLAAGDAFNCVLCAEVLDTKERVMEHWSRRHHCEQPTLLWDALRSYSGREDDDDLDTPASSPHYPA